MATPKLENYLRTYRKRSGLTQREVAFLVGCRNGAQVSRYEKRRRLPPLRTALACEAAFGVPVSELFAGLREVAGQAVGERLAALKSKLETMCDRAASATWFLKARRFCSTGACKVSATARMPFGYRWRPRSRPCSKTFDRPSWSPKNLRPARRSTAPHAKNS